VNDKISPESANTIAAAAGVAAEPRTICLPSVRGGSRLAAGEPNL